MIKPQTETDKAEAGLINTCKVGLSTEGNPSTLLLDLNSMHDLRVALQPAITAALIKRLNCSKKQLNESSKVFDMNSLEYQAKVASPNGIPFNSDPSAPAIDPNVVKALIAISLTPSPFLYSHSIADTLKNDLDSKGYSIRMRNDTFRKCIMLLFFLKRKQVIIDKLSIKFRVEILIVSFLYMYK
jgi:hypothetical protein